MFCGLDTRASDDCQVVGQSRQITQPHCCIVIIHPMRQRGCVIITTIQPPVSLRCSCFHPPTCLLYAPFLYKRGEIFFVVQQMQQVDLLTTITRSDYPSALSRWEIMQSDSSLIMYVRHDAKCEFKHCSIITCC